MGYETFLVQKEVERRFSGHFLLQEIYRIFTPIPLCVELDSQSLKWTKAMIPIREQ